MATNVPTGRPVNDSSAVPSKSFNVSAPRSEAIVDFIHARRSRRHNRHQAALQYHRRRPPSP